jgi:cyclic beta-1,2-glucan synthetase
LNLAGKSLPDPTNMVSRPAAAEEPIRAEFFGIERLEQHARSLAAAQHVGRDSGGGNRLERRLRDNEIALRRAYIVTMASARDARSITPAADWLVDNFHVVQEQVSAIRIDLPPKFQRELPKLGNGPFEGFPRVYGLAWALIAHTDSCFDTQTLRRFLHAYQEVQTLSIGELWAVAIALRMVLVENLRRLAETMVQEQADRESANELADALLGTRGEASGVDLGHVKLPLPMAFAVQFVRRLRAEDPAVAAALRWLDASLAAQGTTAERIVEAEQQRQGAANVTIRNVITSMRLMSSIDWRALFESVSPVDAVLVPASNFAELDFATRELYRHAIEKLARYSPKSEIEITRLILQQAASATQYASVDAGKQGDPGYYLIGRGRAAFEAQIGCRIPWKRRLLRLAAAPSVAFYIAMVACLTALILLAAVSLAGQAMPGWAFAMLALLGILPASDAAVALVNGGATRRVAATALPALALEEGIPESLRTLVAIPIMLTSEEAILGQVRLLEVLHLANNDGELSFVLLSDFADSPTQTQPDDAALLIVAAAAIDRLNARHGPAAGGARFRLLHRKRLWNPGQEKWMGWERKRGKLHELNRLLRGAADTNFIPTPCGPPGVPSGVRYVIVLDGDTRLPRGAAKRLIGKMAHPLNRPVIDAASGRVINGHGVLQPRVTPALPVGAEGSLYQWAFGNTSGIDPYASAASDVYQDLFGEGSYCGKGIYDVDAFEAALHNRIPENTLLSHDLLEGIFARAGLASDIEVIDSFPSRYDVAVSRQLRWVRGDWQLLPWIFGFGSGRRSTRAHGAVPLVGRWKMIDNLRRSISAPAAFAALVGGWSLPLVHPLRWSAYTVLTIATPALIPFLTSIFPRRNGLAKLMHLFAVAEDLRLAAAQTGLLLAFLPYQAWAISVAILRTLFRMFVSRRNLLSWVTADQAQGRKRPDFLASCRRMKGGVLLTVAAAALLFWSRRHAFPVAAPFLLLWLASPAIAPWVSRAAPRGCARPPKPEQIVALRLIARRTWGFFETFVTANDNMLPPDNFQEDPKPVIAHRTSPTNIGLYLLSVASAADFGWIGMIEAVERLEATFAAMHRLARHRGHFYNWYDTQDLRALEPQYISSVDSGNLAGHLIAIWNFCAEMANRPIIPADWGAGIEDPLALLEAALAGAGNSPNSPQLRDLSGAIRIFAAALRPHSSTPTGIAAQLAALAILAAKLPALARALPVESPASAYARDEAAIWADAIIAAIEGQRRCLTTLLPWAVHLAADPRTQDCLAFASLVEKMPSLASLRALCAEAGALLALGHEGSGDAPAHKALAKTLRDSAEAADEISARFRAIETAARALLDPMKFDFLFDAERELLSIGYRCGDGSLEPNFYDLLASEARLASFVAIARGDLPTRHWFRLGRAMAAVGTGAALVSWSGSMFEYLMPSLVMRAPGSSLIERTNCEVVRQQMRYGARRGVPWGASESAYNARDLEFTYQYSSFGIPSLGLKHGLGDSTVIAPYATALAAMVDPRAASENFSKLAACGGSGRYGFYEALDFTAANLPEGTTCAVVRAYMAHHQGMSIVAIAEALCGGAMRRRFHAEPMIEATELLLQERMPHDVVLAEPIIETAPASASVGDSLLSTQRRFDSPHAFSPRTHLMSNGSYAVMITGAGSGYSRWRGLAVNRWREDATCDSWGSYVFVRDRHSGSVWSAGYLPTSVEPESFHIAFSEGRAEITRRDGEITTTMEIAVSSEDDAEVRRVSVTNHGSEARELEITSYAELVLAEAAADIAHPAFAKMFVETSFLPEFSALLATRRRRDPNEAEIWAAHIAVLEGRKVGDVQFETDRARFIGRGRSIRAPLAMQRTQPLSNTQGCVLDPIFSLRRTVRLPPKTTARIAFWTFCADSRDTIISMLDRHHEPAAFDRATMLAWTQAQVQLRHLGLDADDANVFQRIANRVIYADQTLRAPPDVIARGAGPVSLLWQYGSSGDRPIVLLTVEEQSDLDLVRRLLLAHEYWGLKQLSFDLVILNEQTNSYAQEFGAELVALVNANRLPPAPALRSAKGAIFVLREGLVSAEARALLMAASRAVFSGKRGSLAEQIGRVAEPKTAAAPPWRLNAPATPRGMPKPQLRNWNGFGGFSEDGRDYVTILENGASTPAPWMNVICSPHFGFMVSAEGSGSTWSLDSQQNHLTPWSNDPVCDPPGEAIFLRDEQTGDVWTPTALPIRLPGARYVARHGQGFSRFEHASHGIGLDLVQFVPVDDPVKISRLTITNLSGAARRLSVTAYAEWLLGAAPPSAPLILTWIDATTGALFARNPWNIDFGGRVAFADLAGPQTSFTGDRRAFLGRNGTLNRPIALLKPGPLPNTVGAGLDPCAALQTLLQVPANGTVEVVFLLGQTASAEEAQALIAKYRVKTLDAAFAAVTAQWDDILGAVQVKTPDPDMDILLNRWLLYQTLSCRIWARAGFYQASGAYGFRDQLQDTMALCVARPDIARAQLLRAAARQFLQGDVQHWWLPQSGKGIRTRISDDRVWLAYVTAHYVSVTGDAVVLDEQIPYLAGPVLKDGESDAFFAPPVSNQLASLFDHCALALDQSLATGAHGLPLIGTGDWNDGMNRVGQGGRGESIWLGWLLHATLTGFGRVADSRGDTTHGAAWRAHAGALATSLEENGWDGNWYRRAYFDDGAPLGAAVNTECRIDSIAQSWGVISGAANPARAAQAMAEVDKTLVRREDSLVLLFAPPFENPVQDPGYIAGYPPGVRENGGQYTHGAIWSVIAFAMLGDGDKAAGLFSLINPINHAKTPQTTLRYAVEPYVVAADVYAVSPHAGRGGWTWYTGSAGWMYRAGLEWILGFRVLGAELLVDPCVPKSWPGFEIAFRHHSATYEIRVDNPQGVSRGIASATLDGKALPGAQPRFKLDDDGKTHSVHIVLGDVLASVGETG